MRRGQPARVGVAVRLRPVWETRWASPEVVSAPLQSSWASGGDHRHSHRDHRRGPGTVNIDSLVSSHAQWGDDDGEDDDDKNNVTTNSLSCGHLGKIDETG